MSQIREVQLVNKIKSDKIRPTVIKWKGQWMMRRHSFLATVQEIVNFSSEIDVCRIGILGDMHSGKSTLAQAIAHAIHKKAKVPYAIEILNKEELLNFQETLKKLKPVNYILIFDDVSFLGAEANKKQIEMVKMAITTIRHLQGGSDVKIIAMMNYHYSLGLDKYIRQADFKYVTTIGSSENENYEKMFGPKYAGLLKSFKKLRHNAVTKKYWLMTLGEKEPFKYEYRQPFIPVLYWNEDTLRLIVTPTRQWMDKICSVCEEAAGDINSDINIEDFCKHGEANFDKGNFLAAVKLNLYVEGMTVYGKHVVQALRWISKERMLHKIPLEAIAVHYGLNITNTKNKKKEYDPNV